MIQTHKLNLPPEANKHADTEGSGPHVWKKCLDLVSISSMPGKHYG